MLLSAANDDDFDVLMGWFEDELAVRQWGGPNFRYPFTSRSFREDMGVGTLDSFVYRSVDGELLAFGQVYEMLGRGHLARLVVSPRHRGRGVGSDLVNDLCAKASEFFKCSGHSLYVMRKNATAVRCYERAGFVESPYPRQDGMGEEIMFMVR